MQYFISMYHAVLMIGGNEMGGRTDLELAFQGIVMLLGAIINANIFGEMAVLLELIGRKAQRFQDSIDISNTTMKNLQLPKPIQSEVIDYLIFT